MTTEESTLPPPVMWAQRAQVVFLTINLEDVQTPEIKFNKDSVHFKGLGGLEKKMYEVEIPLYRPIDPAKCKSFNRERCIEVVLTKASASEPYWPFLTADKKKHHWLKVDFNKWNDEDESGDDEGLGGMGMGGGMGGMGMGGAGGGDFEEMMRQMGGLGGGGGPGGADKPAFDDLEDDEDSDDGPIPDLE